MARYCFGLQFGMALIVALGLATASRAQTAVPPTYYTGPTSSTHWATTSTAPVCKVYSLSDIGDDAKLCQWIADTIPQMIQPDAWKSADGKAKLSYFAPGKVLVISQTPAVHAHVDEFLQNMKKSLSQTKTAKRDPQVVQAQFAPAAGPMPPAYNHVGPQTPPAPKHLFHFILGVGMRYEGEGIIDSNVVKFAKAMNGPGTCVPNAAPINAYSSEPMKRMEQLLTDSDSLRQVQDEFRKMWTGDQPSGVQPTTQWLRNPPQYVPPQATPPMPPADAPLTLSNSVPAPPPVPSGPPIVPTEPRSK
jgi:hypothetical protein